MKMSKRIFVCLIALAIGVSMFALGVFADAGELKYTTENHASILEYYEEPIIFGMDFDAETAGAGYTHAQLVNVKKDGDAAPKNTTSIVSGNGGKYLSVAGGSSAMKANAMFVNWNAEAGAEIDDFILEFDVMASGSGNRIVEIYVGDSAASVGDIIKTSGVPGTSVVKIDFKAGKIEYVNANNDGKYAYETLTATLTANAFYHVSLTYSVVNNAVSFSMTDGETAVASYKDGIIPTETVGNVRIGSSLANMQNSTIALDNIVASGGSFARVEADKVSETDLAITNFIAICQNPDLALEDKVAVVNTGMRLISVHGVVGESEDAKANVNTFKKIGVGLLVEQLNSCVSGIVDDAPYAERVEYVNSFKKFFDLIPEDISFMDDVASCQASINAYAEEVAKLDTFKTHSEAVLAALADAELTNTNVKSYSYLKHYYDLIADYTPYIGYPGVADIIDAYNTVVTKFSQLEKLGIDFTENVGIAANTENTFGVRFEAYTVARDSYFDDLAYPGIVETLALYTDIELEMKAIIDLCDEFILNVNRADYSQYLSAKQNALASASLTLDEITAKYSEYPGIENAVERYAQLVVSVSDSVAAAEAYVAFMNNLIATASGMSKAELQTAINQALELQKTGNVIGVDGVTEANIALNNMQSDLELTVGYKNQFTNLVTELLAEKDSAAKFDIMIEALGAIENANKYEGVDSADKTKLDSVIAEYNAKIQALNTGFAKANDVACNTVAASSGNNSDNANVGRVIALIKKFYE